MVSNSLAVRWLSPPRRGHRVRASGLGATVRTTLRLSQPNVGYVARCPCPRFSDTLHRSFVSALFIAGRRGLGEPGG